MIRLGMSGFSYPEWIGEIYPVGTKRKDMLSAYANVFNVVEVNSSFRQNPKETTIDTWRDSVPDDFRFCLKANQRITHWRRLVETKDVVEEFMAIAKRLGTKLGPVLFQAPPNLKFDEAIFDAFCAELVPDAQYAFEPRHPTFQTPEAFAALKRNNVALCLNDDRYDPSTYTLTGSCAYFRFHREGSYTPEELQTRANLVRKLSEQTDVYVFFSHEDNPESVAPALRFAELIA